MLDEGLIRPDRDACRGFGEEERHEHEQADGQAERDDQRDRDRAAAHLLAFALSLD